MYSYIYLKGLLFRYIYQRNKVIGMSGLVTNYCTSQMKNVLFPNLMPEKLQYSLVAVAAETVHITVTAKLKRVMTHLTNALPQTLAS